LPDNALSRNYSRLSQTQCLGIEYFGERLAEEPLYDPMMKRLHVSAG
jgi:hypothetical protein